MKDFTFLGLTIHPFGALLALCCAAGIVWFALAGRKKLVPGAAAVFTACAIPLSFVFSRLLMGLFSSGWYLMNTGFLFNFNRGGYLLYGVFAGCGLAALICKALLHQKVSSLLDTLAAPGAFMLMCGRFLQGLAGSGYGLDLNDWFGLNDDFQRSLITDFDPEPLCVFPISVQTRYSWSWNIAGLSALVLLVILIILLCTKSKRSGGRITLLLLLYAGMQTTLETLRCDAILKLGFVKISQVTSLLLVLAVWGICLVRAGKNGLKLSVRARFLPAVGVALCAGLILVMEFAVEKRISFLKWMIMDECHLVMFIASILMILCVIPLWKKAFGQTKA